MVLQLWPRPSSIFFEPKFAISLSLREDLMTSFILILVLILIVSVRIVVIGRVGVPLLHAMKFDLAQVKL